jgi:electron transfer flavoprotein beta subunit
VNSRFFRIRRQSMNIVVLAKQVPDPEALVRIVAEGKGLEIEQKFTANLFDEVALEEALRIKEKLGGKVKVITLGGGKAIEVLRTGIAMGADEALLLDDVAFLDGDGISTALALSRAAAMEPFDIILCGRQAIDDDRGEVGPMVAQFLALPHAGGIVHVDIADGKATAECEMEGKQVVEVSLPAVLTVERALNEPRTAPVMGVMKAMRATIPKATPADLGLAAGQVGSSGSKTKVEKYLSPRKREEVRMIQGEPADAATEAVRILVDVERVI